MNITDTFVQILTYSNQECRKLRGVTNRNKDNKTDTM